MVLKPLKPILVVLEVVLVVLEVVLQLLLLQLLLLQLRVLLKLPSPLGGGGESPTLPPQITNNHKHTKKNSIPQKNVCSVDIFASQTSGELLIRSCSRGVGRLFNDLIRLCFRGPGAPH